MENNHFDITVKGRVQGVWYRKFVCDHALELNIKGFVKNLPNGNVYLEVEGDPRKIDQLKELLKEGPPLANVSEVNTKEGAFVGFEDFKISR